MKWGDKYPALHVNVFANMLARNLKMDYRLVCITDDPSGIECETIPLWDDDSEGCFRRLELFSPRMKDVIGNRFVSIDLDCVIVKDITPLLSRKEDFVIWQAVQDKYCGSMFMMDAGARAKVSEVPRVRHKRWRGTDQAVIRATLGPNEAVWKKGIYLRQRVKELPEDARIIFYAGPRDPSKDKVDWAVEHWR